MKILVTFALEHEFAPWRRMRRFKRASVDQWDNSYRTRIDDADVRVFVTGAGRFASQRAATIALEEPADACVVSGLAGGLRGDCAFGNVLVARNVGITKGGATQPGHPDLVAAAVSAGARSVERLITADHVITSSDEKRQLGDAGDAVDMESFWILSAAAHLGVPSVAIRAISDTVDSNLPLDFEKVFNAQGTVSVPKVIGQLAASPSKLGGLLRLAHDSERAAANLARVLDLFVRSVTALPLGENTKIAALSV